MTRRRSFFLALLLLVATAAAAAPPVDYIVSLRDVHKHLVHVRMQLPGTAAEQDVQLPVWNALYQVRDFAQFVRAFEARDANGRRLPVRKLDKTTWRVSEAYAGASIQYTVYADSPGPYGMQANKYHAFFNLAQLLMYPLGMRDTNMTVTFTDIPAGWKVATALAPFDVSNGRHTYSAAGYDRLVDAPVELGRFDITSFDEAGARFWVVVDADRRDYQLDAIVAPARRVVRAAIDYMGGDRPFREFWFLYHFPRGPGSGGMEHADSTAIDIAAERLADDPFALTSLTAHEFFHLWNVKRLRPASLEPIDYRREQYTRSLWFAEGVTSTVGSYVLLRAGLMTEAQYLSSLAREIRALQLRPARLTQSVEDSSLDTWFDKYPQYRLPERSISYYNKGELLGVLLDLAIRDATGGRKSLRELFRYMNDRWGKPGKPYPDADGIREALHAVTGKDFSSFFERYVAGTEELPYDQYFATVGLRLIRRKVTVPYTGFTVVRNFDQPPVVVHVEEGEEADRAGLEQGDQIVAVNGKTLTEELDDRLAAIRVGDTVRFRVVGRRGERDIKVTLAGQAADEFMFADVPAMTPAQRSRRHAWLRGDVEP